MNTEVVNDQTISRHLVIYQEKNCIVSDMGSEKVLLSIENGKYYNLGEIGGSIWELIKEPILVGQVIDALAEEYEVDRVECELQAFSFLTHLFEEKLVTFSI